MHGGRSPGGRWPRRSRSQRRPAASDRGVVVCRIPRAAQRDSLHEECRDMEICFLRRVSGRCLVDGHSLRDRRFRPGLTEFNETGAAGSGLIGKRRFWSQMSEQG